MQHIEKYYKIYSTKSVEQSLFYLLKPTILSGTLISSLHIPPTLEETGLDPWLPESPIELPVGPPRMPIKGSATNDAIFFASGSKNIKCNTILVTTECNMVNIYKLLTILY